MIKDAKFSDDGTRRFWLKRDWNGMKPALMLIGLNPSTANAETDDPTIRRIIGLAKENGYGAIVMTNLFSQVTAYPKELTMDFSDEDNGILLSVKMTCTSVCFCWGNFHVSGRDEEMIKMFPGALCFGKNKNGSPKHPLYLKGNTQLIKF